MKLTEEQKAEIDALFAQYRIDKDEPKLMKALEAYAMPDGSWSLYVRWQLDVISYL